MSVVSAPRPDAPGAPQAAPDELILAAFEERAGRAGIKAVVMAELAADLRMSTKTLYRLYPTKQELVGALMQRWATVLLDDQRSKIAAAADPVGRIKAAAQTGVDHVARFCPRFWSDLRRDYPQQYGVYRDAVAEAFAQASAWIQAALRPGLGMEVAGPLLMAAIRTAADPAWCERVGVTRRSAVDAAVEIWARGALAPDALLDEGA